jgi:hypothetical protein
LRHQVAERVEQREQLAEANTQLNATAQAHGLNTRSCGLLHDAGTRGLYGGLGVDDVIRIPARLLALPRSSDHTPSVLRLSPQWGTRHN